MFEKIDCSPGVAKTLSGQIRAGAVAGAYIFAGGDRDTKYKTAIEFVRILNCKTSSEDVCGRCESCLNPFPLELFCHKKPSCMKDPPCHLCLKRDRNSNSLFMLITSDKSLGIDPCRYLIHFMTRKSAKGMFKAAVIRESELLTPEAENSLLKILEEPPDNCLIILITQSLHSLLPTIRSRAQILRFPPEDAARKMGDSDRALAFELARLRESRNWKGLFEKLKKFHAVSAKKDQTLTAVRREKTRAFIESLMLEGAEVMRKNPSERLSFELEYLHECALMLKKQRMPNVVLSRMLFLGIPSFVEGNQ